MSKQHRTRLIKSIEQQLEETTDPKIKADLSRQLTKLLSSPRQPSRAAQKAGEKPKNKNRSLREIYTGSVYDAMSDGELVLHHLVVQFETKDKEHRIRTGQKFTKPERDALVKELKDSLSAEELAAYEALHNDEAV